MAWASGSAFASWPCCASSVTPLDFSEPGLPPLLTGLQDHRDSTCSSSRRDSDALPTAATPRLCPNLPPLPRNLGGPQ